jgi:hypothetical protein
MPNKYNDPQGHRNPNDRLPTPIEQEDIQYQRERAAGNNGAANGLLIVLNLALHLLLQAKVLNL